MSSRQAVGCLCAVVAVAATLAATRPASADPAPRFNPPKSYYLALGDSYAYGFQNSKFLAGLPPAGFDTGYVDLFAARLRAIRPGIAVVNYGCPGESTTSFIAGPCPFQALGLQLHDTFEASQLDAATAFLGAHPGQVSPITLQLFGNDMGELIRSCAGDFACIEREAPAAIARFGQRLAVIVERLRAAAPEAEIIVIGGWNTRIDFLAESDPLVQAANATMGTVAVAAGARFADMIPVFNPLGGSRLATICTLTLLCSDGDVHPSDAGYQAMAGAVFDASGYARRRRSSMDCIQAINDLIWKRDFPPPVSSATPLAASFQPKAPPAEATRLRAGDLLRGEEQCAR
jgi:lysophospholipase L1-like esterase